MNGQWRLTKSSAAYGGMVLAGWLLAANAVLASEVGAPIGYVKTVSGEAWVGAAGAERKAEVGTPVLLGATLRTGPAASLGVTLRDNTVMSFGPDTELVVDEYLFDPDAQSYGFGARMARGTLNFISGLIAKARPDAQVIRTPTGTIGVRGTHFLVKVQQPGG